MQLQSSTDQWQIADDIPVYDGYYAGLTITDHVREMVQRRMAPTEYAAEIVREWCGMTATWVSDDIIEQLADDLQSELDHLRSSAGLA